MELLTRLVDHMKWADAQALDALRAMSPPPPDALRWYAHVLAAERLWYMRLRGEDWTIQPVWPTLTLDECTALSKKNAQSYDEYAARLNERELARAVTYKNSKGETFTNSVADILTQVLLHGAHHRGQIAASLRAAGATPPVLDYIRFVREY